MSYANMDSALPALTKSQFEEVDFSTRPVLKDAISKDIKGHVGYIITFPNMPDLPAVNTLTSPGSNATPVAINSSGSKCKMRLYNYAVIEDVETIMASIKPMLKQISKKLLNQALDMVDFDCVKTLAWQGGIFRADADPNHQAIVAASAVSSGTDFFTSAAGLGGYDDNAFNGGRGCIYSGPGMGSSRVIDLFTTGTGVCRTGDPGGGDEGVDPWNEQIIALDWSAQAAGAVYTGSPASQAFVSNTAGITASDVLASDVLLGAEFMHRQRFMTPITDGPTDYTVYISNFGWKQLMNDPVFMSIMQNYRGEFFNDPKDARNSWMNLKLKVMTNGFRCGNTGAKGDAAYSATGAVHFYPMVGKEAFQITQLSISPGKRPGGIKTYSVTERDHSNHRPAYFTFGHDAWFASHCPIASKVLNIACGSSES